MNQSELPFAAHKLARASDPETSKAAARQCKALRADHHQKIVAALRRLTTANADEIAQYCDLDRVQVGRRLNELERAGLVRKTGETRPTASGRAACCYGVVR